MATPIFDTNRKWSLDYPELGTEPVPTEPCLSSEYFELERERVFRKVWLYVGRQEELPHPGDYLVRDLPACNTSIIFVRGKDGKIRGFHNICSHRGNKLAWDAGGSCQNFACKFHGWVYDTQGQLVGVPDEDMFYNLDKSENGLVPVATDVWEGFLYVNVDPQPQQTLHEYLGELGTRLSGFPYAKLTARYAYQTELKCNWKIALI
jgi:phenylpropionate dioxygenase-like ring-hydroxylating dioxygenase large terminal subunit